MSSQGHDLSNGREAGAEDGGEKAKCLPPEVEECRERLVAHYKEKKVLVGYGLFEESGKPVEEIFVGTALVYRSSLDELFCEDSVDNMAATARSPSHALHGSVISETVIGLGDLFAARPDVSGQVIRGVLALGSAGMGKSTVFCYQLPYEWAFGRCMADIDLLLCVSLSETNTIQIRCTEDLLTYVLDLGSDEKKVVLRYIRQNPSRVCIIFDGVDECEDIMKSPFILTLLTGKAVVGGVKTIVTSRHCTTVHELAQKGCFDRRVEVLGFSDRDVNTFIGKALPRADLASNMRKKLQENANTASLMRTPFMASLCCQEFESSSSLAGCMTSLFEKMVVRLLEKQVKKSFSSLGALLPEQKFVLHELGRFALVKLFAREFVFCEADNEMAKLSEKAEKLGILVASEKGLSRNKPRLYKFSHALLHEFFAAFYAASHLLHSVDSIVDLAVRAGIFEAQSTPFFVFLIALADKSNFSLFKLCESDSVLDDYGKFGAIPLLLENDELEKIHSLLCTCMDRPAMNSLADVLLTGIVAQEKGGHVAVANRMSTSREPCDADFLKLLLEYWREEQPFASKALLLAALKKIKTAESTLEEEEMKMFFSDELTSRPNKQEVSKMLNREEKFVPTHGMAWLRAVIPDPRMRLQYFGAFAYCSVMWNGLCERMKRFDNILEKEVISFFSTVGAILIARDVIGFSAKIADVIPLLQPLKLDYLWLWDEDISKEPGLRESDSVQVLLLRLQKSPGIKHIRLHDIMLPTARLVALSVLLSSQKATVGHFQLVNTTASHHCDSLQRLLPGLLVCSNMLHLQLTGVNLDFDSVRQLSEALQSGKMTMLTQLTVSSIMIGSDGCNLLLQSLLSGSCPSLQLLSLESTGLSVACAGSVCEVIHQCHELRVIDLRGNQLHPTPPTIASLQAWYKLTEAARSKPALDIRIDPSQSCNIQ